MRQPPSIGIHTCRLQKTDYVCTLSVVIWEFALTICERDLGCQVATLTTANVFENFFGSLRWHLMCQAVDCQYV